MDPRGLGRTIDIEFPPGLHVVFVRAPWNQIWKGFISMSKILFTGKTDVTANINQQGLRSGITSGGGLR